MTHKLIATDYGGADNAYESAIPTISFSASALQAHTGSTKRRNVATDGLGNWVISGDPNGQYSNDDGGTWNNALFVSIGTYDLIIDSVIWTGREFLAFCYLPGSAGIYVSADGSVWEGVITNFNDLTERHAGFARFRSLWLMLEQSPVLSPAHSQGIRYSSDPREAWTDGHVVTRDWDVGVGVVGVANQLVMPRPLAATDDIVLAFSINANDIEWSEDPTAGSPFTAGTHTGTGQIWCAAWDGTQWVGGGQYDSGGGAMRFNWATSPDGKAWTHHNEPTFGAFCLVDVFFDGKNFWFAAIQTLAGVGSVWQYDGSTWTTHPMPGGTTGGLGIAGWPFSPYLIESAPAALAADLPGVYVQLEDSGVVVLDADDLAKVTLSESGVVGLAADDVRVVTTVQPEQLDNAAPVGDGRLPM